MFTYTQKDLDRFWAKVKYDDEGCWEWTSQTRGGYGIFWLSGKVIGAHRFSLFLSIGEYEGLACHTCDNPPCVRPDHLFPGSYQDNSDDMFAKGRKARKQPYQKVEKRKVIKLSPEDVLEILEALKKPYHGQGNDLARKYGVTHSLISHIKTGRFRPAALISGDEKL